MNSETLHNKKQTTEFDSRRQYLKRELVPQSTVTLKTTPESTSPLIHLLKGAQTFATFPLFRLLFPVLFILIHVQCCCSVLLRLQIHQFLITRHTIPSQIDHPILPPLVQRFPINMVRLPPMGQIPCLVNKTAPENRQTIAMKVPFVILLTTTR